MVDYREAAAEWVALALVLDPEEVLALAEHVEYLAYSQGTGHALAELRKWWKKAQRQFNATGNGIHAQWMVEYEAMAARVK